MADDVAQQEEGITSLHLRILRKEWRVVCLQLVASLALIWLFAASFLRHLVQLRGFVLKVS